MVYLGPDFEFKNGNSRDMTKLPKECWDAFDTWYANMKKKKPINKSCAYCGIKFAKTDGRTICNNCKQKQEQK